MSRRRFFQTAAGMASAFLAMNDTYGPIYRRLARRSGRRPSGPNERAKQLSGQFIMDMHTHFLRPGTRIKTSSTSAAPSARRDGTPALAGKEQTIDDLMFANYLKEIYLDSDTKVACISGAPSEVPEDWFLTNEMKAQARASVNGLARQQAHVRARDLHARLRRLDGRRSITRIADAQARFDEGLHDRRQHEQEPVASIRGGWTTRSSSIPRTRSSSKAGLTNVCIHKGLFPPSVEKQFPHLLAYSRRARRRPRPRRTGRSSTSSSITAAIAGRAAARSATRGRSSSRPAASNG